MSSPLQNSYLLGRILTGAGPCRCRLAELEDSAASPWMAAVTCASSADACDLRRLPGERMLVPPTCRDADAGTSLAGSGGGCTAGSGAAGSMGCGRGAGGGCDGGVGSAEVASIGALSRRLSEAVAGIGDSMGEYWVPASTATYCCGRDGSCWGSCCCNEGEGILVDLE